MRSSSTDAIALHVVFELAQTLVNHYVIDSIAAPSSRHCFAMTPYRLDIDPLPHLNTHHYPLGSLCDPHPINTHHEVRRIVAVMALP